MVQITSENRPICAKSKEKPALMLLSGMWICGQCYHEYSQRLIKLNQKAFLEG